METFQSAGLVEQEQINLWSALLEHTYPELSFYVWTADSLEAYDAYVQDKDEVSNVSFEAAVCRSVRRYRLVLFVFRRKQTQEHKSGHVTLLAVESEPHKLDQAKVKYYDAHP